MKLRLRTALAVTAILAVVGVLIRPVLAQFNSPLVTLCLERKSRIAAAFMMYSDDWDGYAVPARRYIEAPLKPPDILATGILTPYYRGYFKYLRCPADLNAVDKTLSLDPDGKPPATYEQMVYDFTMRTDVGYNFQYLAPIVCDSNGWCYSRSIQTYRMPRPYITFLFLDSVWSRSAIGLPRGGGRWLVEPPAVRLPDGTLTLPLPSNTVSFQSFGGWNPSKPLAANVYGSVWPWHVLALRPRVGVIYGDGHAAAIPISEVTAGCTVQDNWGGAITDLEKYHWSSTY